MMGMIAHHTGNLLEFESSCTRPSFITQQTRETSHDSSSSSTSSSTVPEMILSISLQSFTESDDTDTASLDDTLSWGSTSEPGARGSSVRTRSIFSSYWSSPAHVINDHNDVDDLEILERMRSLKMPTVEILSGIVSDDSPAGEEEPLSKIQPTSIIPAVEALTAPHRPTIDDDVVNYRPSFNKSQSTPIINRRRILPPPPPPKVIPQSPSMTRLSSRSSQSQQSPRNELAPYGKRPWSSTTTLLVGSNYQVDVGLKGSNVIGSSPQSCLRKPRYSLSGQDLAVAAEETQNDDINDTSSANFVRSVSFYSEVRVVEYIVPEVHCRSQVGWSKFFIGQVE